MRERSLEIRSWSSAIGAEVFGADLSRPLDDRGIGEIRRAFLEYQVLFFRDHYLTPEQQVAFSRTNSRMRKLKENVDGRLARIQRRRSFTPSMSEIACLIVEVQP